MFLHVHVCVCEREREGEIGRDRQIETYRHRERPVFDPKSAVRKAAVRSPSIDGLSAYIPSIDGRSLQ